MKKLQLCLSTALVALAAVPASAATLYSNPTLLSATSSPGSTGFSVSSSGGAGTLNFNIDGFNTLDGLGFYEDDFTLALNGATILSLSYDLGGGGANAIFTNTFGAAVTGGAFGFGGGGQLQVSIASLVLAAGANSFTFAYDSPSGDALGGMGSHAGPQGIGDEGWGISGVVLTGTSATTTAPVPEPASWSLMILGFGAIGGALRSRRIGTRATV